MSPALRILAGRKSKKLAFLLTAILFTTLPTYSGLASTTNSGTTFMAIRIEQVGGFVGPNFKSARLPTVVVYSDGLILAEGNSSSSVRKMYRSAISPAVVKSQVSFFTRLIKTPSGGWGTPGVADVPSTQILVKENGKSRIVDVYALGFKGGKVSNAAVAARTRLAKSIGALTKLAGSTTIFSPLKYEIWPLWPSAHGSPSPSAILWPENIPIPVGRCSPAKAGPFRALLQRAGNNQWLLPDGSVVAMTWRPVLPGEIACMR